MPIRRGTIGAAVLALAAIAPAPSHAQQTGTVELFGFGQYAKYDQKTDLGSHAAGGGGLGFYAARWLSLEADASYASIGMANGLHASHIPLRLRGVLNYPMGGSSLFAGAGGVRTQFGDAMDAHYYGVTTIVGGRFGLGMRGLAVRVDGTGDFHPKPKYAVVGARAGLSMQFGGERTEPSRPPEPVLADRTDSDRDGVNDVSDRCPNTARGAEVTASGCPTQASAGGLVAGAAAPQPPPQPQRQNDLPVVVAPSRDSAMMADSAARAARLRDSVTQAVISRDSAERLEVRRMLEARQATIRDSLARLEQARRDSVAAQPAPTPTVPMMTPPPRTDSAAMRPPVRRDTAVRAATPTPAPARTTPAPAATTPAPAAATPAPESSGPFAGGSTAVLEGVTFTLAAATLEQSSYAVLDPIAEWLLQNPSVRVEVAGYTDASGRRESQVQLSQARAQSVRDYLVQQGVPAARITAKGYGPANPRAGNDTPEDRARNRRIELRRL